MVYKAKEGIIKEKISRLSLFFIGLAFMLAIALTGLASTASAAHVPQ